MRKRKEYRELKVVEQSGYKYKPTPTIILKGQWLKEYGFETNKHIVIECEKGKLTVSLKEDCLNSEVTSD